MSETTLVSQLLGHALSMPDAPAMRVKEHGIWREISWREYGLQVAGLAKQLQKLGVEAEGNVSILSDNRPEWLFADLAAQALGARSVGIYQTNPAEDVAYVLRHSRSSVVVCEDQEQVDKVLECAGSLPDLEHIIVLDGRGVSAEDDSRILFWEDLEAQIQASADLEWLEELCASRSADEPTMVVYTSGTTGEPKGAMLASANVVGVAAQVAPLLGAGPSDQIISYLPLCHVAEKIFTIFLPLSVGATVHFGESIATIQEDLREVSPTIFLGVPRIWEKMHASVVLKMKDASWLKRTLFDFFVRRGEEIARRRIQGNSNFLDTLVFFLGHLLVFRALRERLGLARCRHPISGAAPISQDLLWWFHGIGVPVLEGYGQTECSGVSHLNPPRAPKIGTVGAPVELVDFKLAEDGEILVRGPMVFKGYLHDAEATARTLDDGWLKTGDIGEVDDENYLKITGRKKEIIITAGGKNLSPEKIENALKMSPFIKEAVAIGDRRKFVGALIQIDADAVGDWARRRGIDYTSFQDLVQKPEVSSLISSEVESANERLAQVEQVRGFKLLPKELHQDDGEMTATQKVRRSAVEEKFSDLIESMYTKT